MKTMSELEQQLLGAALRYIQLSPCDPDITPEQWDAWQEFDALRTELRERVRQSYMDSHSV